MSSTSASSQDTLAHNDFDLIIHCGRCYAPELGFEHNIALEVGIVGQQIAQVAPQLSRSASHRLEFPRGILLPGLIDLHAHPARSGSKYGVDPDREFLPHGVTTVMSQGDAGAESWNKYRRDTIRGSRTRVRLALNLSAPGESMAEGCFSRLEWADVEACIRTIEQEKRQAIGECRHDEIWGIAVNVSRLGCGETDPHEIVRRALVVANATGKPLLYGLRETADWPLDQQLKQLRNGDVVTYCFRGPPASILDAGNQRVHPAAWEARSRGVLFDVGHGMGSFRYAIAEVAIAEGFLPDTISTDQYARHINLMPQHSLPRTMSKLRAAGMSEHDIFAAVTYRPAQILRLDESSPNSGDQRSAAGELSIGRIGPGMCADLCVLSDSEPPVPLADVDGEERLGPLWSTTSVVRAGTIIFPASRAT